MKLLVGLGNPGVVYARNRHNVGFMAVDTIFDLYSFSPWRLKFDGQITDGNIAGKKILILKPETYMNDSGRAVQNVMTFYKINSKNVIILHDEIDLAGGKVKVKRGGGHAGHNGLRNIHSHVGTDYARVRIGIGHPGDKDRVINHVLNDFSKDEYVWLKSLLSSIAERVGSLINGDDKRFQSDIALDMAPLSIEKID